LGLLNRYLSNIAVSVKISELIPKQRTTVENHFAVAIHPAVLLLFLALADLLNLTPLLFYPVLPLLLL